MLVAHLKYTIMERKWGEWYDCRLHMNEIHEGGFGKLQHLSYMNSYATVAHSEY